MPKAFETEERKIVFAEIRARLEADGRSYSNGDTEAWCGGKSVECPDLKTLYFQNWNY